MSDRVYKSVGREVDIICFLKWRYQCVKLDLWNDVNVHSKNKEQNSSNTFSALLRKEDNEEIFLYHVLINIMYNYSSLHYHNIDSRIVKNFEIF